jgi:surface protein
MFKNGKSFNSPLIWGSKVRNVNNMAEMFYGADGFNQDISSWNVGNVKQMWSMFYSADKFNQDISS